MPTTTTRADFCKSTASYAVGLEAVEEGCTIEFETDDQEYVRMLNDEIAAEAAALARAEQMAPRGQEIERLLQRFPAPQEWWDEG